MYSNKTTTDMNQRRINFNRVLFALLLCVGVIMISCEEIQPISVTSVSLNSTSMELVEGTTQTLVATVSPSNAENQKVIWSSNNSSVATVTDGVVTAIKAGTATITVKTDDGNKTATCSVIVVAKEIPVTSVSLDQTEIELLEGDELTLTATVKPDNATNKNVTWTSSNESVATVDNGKITAVKAGSSMITVTTEDGNKSTTCEVTVLHVQSNDVIVFADDIMKELCITAFDTNGDGELSYTEAAEVKSLIYMTLTKKTFKSFDEFQYFTSVTAIPDRYFRGVSIKSIVLPYRLKSIGSYAFQECSSLQSINIPDSVTSIGSSAFKGCSSLQSINIPESVTFIDNSTFSDCSSLQSIDIPESVKTIGNYVFKGCSSLRNIDIPDSVPCIGNEVFKGCSSLQSIDIPESVTYIGESAFYDCSSLQKIYVKSQDCPELAKDGSNRYLMFYNNAPSRKIYVPYKVLDTYKKAEGWSTYADNIVGYDYENNKVVE